MGIGHSSVGIQISASAGVLKISGGSIATTRSITISGSSDITLIGSGSNSISFPSQSTTLLGTDVTQSFSNKSGSFLELQIPAISGSPQFTPSQTNFVSTMVFDTASVPKTLYVYDGVSWRSSSFV